MSITYKVQPGDTFDIIARRQYGTETAAGHIAQANPGVVEPLTAGTVLTTPPIPETPRDAAQQAPATSENEIAIAIDGKRFRFWDSVRITRALDQIDTVEFGAPFDADIPEFREAFRPFSYKPITVTLGGAALFTGTMVGVSPPVENARRVVTVSAYSTPGVLNDCTPAARDPFLVEFNGQSLPDIVKTLAKPFGVGVVFTADPGAVFDRVANKPDKRIWSFFAELAKQRNIVISSTPEGEALFQQSIEPGAPVARLAQGSAPVLSIIPFFNPQEYYSHITGINPVLIGSEGSQFTVKNPRLQGVVRPMAFPTPDTLGGEVKTAVEAKMGRMFGNMASYSIKVATWRDSAGELWAPNTTITLDAPDAMIYGEYEFIIRSVEFQRNRNTEVATLNLVVPGSFNGKIPEALPWEG